VTSPAEICRPDAVPVPAAHVCTANLDDQAVLYDLERRRPILLNVSASVVWGALDGVHTVAEVASALAERFGVDTAVVLRDVEATIVRFGELGLLRGVTPVFPPDAHR